ncbi:MULTISPECIES: daptide-type RiPP [Streptomyces]|uniref:daptide-type RiPP n=1 Tax=Streptomyces TaxID=1883 RepID=UPI00378B3E74
MQENTLEETAGFNPSLELGLQELEAMEAPGFWSGAGVVASAVGSFVASTVSVLT